MPEVVEDEKPGEAAKTVSMRWAYPVLVSIPLIVLNAGWIANSEMKTGVTEITITTLFMGVAFILFWVTLLNLAARRFLGPRVAMSQPELMLLYSLLSIATSIAGIGNIGFFLTFVASPYWMGKAPDHRWRDFFPYFSFANGPSDPDVIKGFHEGRSTFFTPATMAAWMPSLAFWSVFFLLLLWTMFCLATIVRRRWMEEEHLTFPVVALPLEMTRDGGPLYKNRLLWIGFAIPCFLHSLNSLNSLYPTIPAFPINTLKEGLDGVNYPWTGLGSIPILIHPSGVGFGFLVNVDVLFSMFFFFFLKKFMNLFGVLMNWSDPNSYDGADHFPYTGFQSWGAWLAVGVTTVWTGWPYFRAYLDRAFDGDREGIDRGEPLSARVAVFGFFGGFLILSLAFIALGGSFWVSAAFLGIYIVIMLTLSRLQAETAVLSPLLGWVDPQSILPGVLGVTAFRKTELVQMATLSWCNLDYRAAPMPQQLQAMVGLRRAGVNNLRPLVLALGFAAVVGLVSALLWDLQLYYTYGASTANVNPYRTAMGNSPYWRLQGWFGSPRPPSPATLIAMASGAGITALLAFCRTRFIGFPLSPAAYLLNITWANELFWLDLFIAWVCKATILRFGGMKLYKAALPFFLGLILGDFVTGASWSLFGTLAGFSLFRTFPN